MSTKAVKLKVSDSYLNLVRQFPLRLIRKEADYDSALKVMKKLALRGEGDLDSGERDYLDALDEFIAIYDRKHFVLGSDHRTPLQRLEYVLTESQTTPSKLQKILGCSQPMVSMILNGTRELSKDNIAKLSRHFKLDVSYFF
jgi:HTH-type transcriptional regulator/antitoxin HigA